MKKFARPLAALLALITVGIVHAAGAAPPPDPLDDPAVQRTLRGMAQASVWFHPDLFGEFAGMRHYAHHQNEQALKYFKIGAFYADKLSQLSVGLMYLNGEGTQKDPVTAYAWLDLAAERQYPDFVVTRDNLKAALTPDQLAQATALRSTLGELYADAVAKPRMVFELHMGQMQTTGSRTGFDSGILHLNTKGTCGDTIVSGGVEVPEAGCANDAIYANDRWDPKAYFASRDRQFKASVTVGAVEKQGQAIDKPAAPAVTTPADTLPDQGVQQH